MESVFFDPMLARHAPLNVAAGPGLFIPLDHPGTVMLVGTGPEAEVLFLGGRFEGECFRQSRAENWEGMLVNGIGFEAYAPSAYSPDRDGKIVRSLVRRGEYLGVFGIAKGGQGFQNTITVDLNDGADPSDEKRLAFKRWRITVGEGDALRVLYTVDLSEE